MLYKYLIHVFGNTTTKFITELIGQQLMLRIFYGQVLLVYNLDCDI